jgi:hypothetical protein
MVVPFAQGTQEPFLALSGDGRYVAYEGTVVTADGGIAEGQVLMYDTCIGAGAGCSPSTVLLWVAVDGAVANALVQTPGVSEDGRRVAFQSSATNLVAPPPSGQAPDVYLRDTCLGSAAPAACMPATTLLFGCTYCTPIDYEDTQLRQRDRSLHRPSHHAELGHPLGVRLRYVLWRDGWLYAVECDGHRGLATFSRRRL